MLFGVPESRSHHFLKVDKTLIQASETTSCSSDVFRCFTDRTHNLFATLWSDNNICVFTCYLNRNMTCILYRNESKVQLLSFECWTFWGGNIFTVCGLIDKSSVDSDSFEWQHRTLTVLVSGLVDRKTYYYISDNARNVK